MLLSDHYATLHPIDGWFIRLDLRNKRPVTDQGRLVYDSEELFTSPVMPGVLRFLGVGLWSCQMADFERDNAIFCHVTGQFFHGARDFPAFAAATPDRFIAKEAAIRDSTRLIVLPTPPRFLGQRVRRFPLVPGMQPMRMDSLRVGYRQGERVEGTQFVEIIRKGHLATQSAGTFPIFSRGLCRAFDSQQDGSLLRFGFGWTPALEHWYDPVLKVTRTPNLTLCRLIVSADKVASTCCRCSDCYVHELLFALDPENASSLRIAYSHMPLAVFLAITPALRELLLHAGVLFVRETLPMNRA